MKKEKKKRAHIVNLRTPGKKSRVRIIVAYQRTIKTHNGLLYLHAESKPAMKFLRYCIVVWIAMKNDSNSSRANLKNTTFGVSGRRKGELTWHRDTNTPPYAMPGDWLLAKFNYRNPS